MDDPNEPRVVVHIIGAVGVGKSNLAALLTETVHKRVDPPQHDPPPPFCGRRAAGNNNPEYQPHNPRGDTT